jgi:hypothetical protein
VTETLPMTVPERLASILADLTTIADLLQWAHADGYQPLAPNHDARRPAAPMPKPGQNADQVKAPLHDIGIGAHDRRRAYQNAIELLAKTEVRVAHACHLITGGHLDLTRPLVHGHLADNLRCVTRMRTMTLATRDDWPTATPIHQHTAELELEIITTATTTIWTGLDRAFNRGPADPNVLELAARCRNHSRGCPGEREAKTGGRCWNCFNHWKKHGQEKPAKAFQSEIALANQAQQRRLDRGDGHGDESASATGDRPIITDMAGGVIPFVAPTPRPLIRKRTGKRHPRRFTRGA